MTTDRDWRNYWDGHLLGGVPEAKIMMTPKRELRNKIQNDMEIVLAACSQDAYPFQYASATLQNDKKFVLRVCSQHIKVLRYASLAFKSDNGNKKQEKLDS